MENITVDSVATYLSTYGLQLLGAVAILIIGRWVARFLTSLCRKSLTRAEVDMTLVVFISNIVNVLLLAFVIIAALSNLGVETTSVAAIFAAAGLAIGLALQGSLSNFAAGVMIIMFRPFKSGDYVEVASTSGTVSEISIFTTKLKTPDNKVVIVPNGNIIANNITNYSAEKTRRIDFVFGIGYGDDLQKAKTILEDILANDERILAEPAPTIGVLELGESSVNIAVRPWVKASDYWPTHFSLLETVKLRFDAEGISIPFPQRDLHVIQTNNAGANAGEIESITGKSRKTKSA